MDEASGILWGYAECAAAIGVAAVTLRAYKAAGRLPEPDAVTASGRPRWRPATFLAWHAARPGRGRWPRAAA